MLTSACCLHVWSAVWEPQKAIVVSITPRKPEGICFYHRSRSLRSDADHTDPSPPLGWDTLIRSAPWSLDAELESALAQREPVWPQGTASPGPLLTQTRTRDWEACSSFGFLTCWKRVNPFFALGACETDTSPRVHVCDPRSPRVWRGLTVVVGNPCFYSFLDIFYFQYLNGPADVLLPVAKFIE